MMFACCHPRLARENQLALTLKALCGFGNAEIARALLVSEGTVKKRLQRATRDLINQHIALDPPAAGEFARRLDAVHQVLYLLFNEGYSSTEGETAVRADLCEDAASAGRGAFTCAASPPPCPSVPRRLRAACGPPRSPSGGRGR